jgi:beta-glucosidase
MFVGGLNHDSNFDTEGTDRLDMKLPGHQDDLIQRIVEANPRTMVVLIGGSPVEMGAWLERVPAVLLGWYGGMEAGNALARILFGDVNPSGKLPCTFPKRLADSPAHALRAYPGADGTVRYEEGLLVGYRWFDTKNIEPLFPFGHGLSYTRFEYSNLRLSQSAAEFDVVNAGERDGGEVAQLYVHDAHPRLARPHKELKGFRKIFLKPGEKRRVTIPLAQDAFAFYDPDRGGWVTEPGAFTILVGSSSRDIRLQGEFVLGQRPSSRRNLQRPAHRHEQHQPHH